MFTVEGVTSVITLVPRGLVGLSCLGFAFFTFFLQFIPQLTKWGENVCSFVKTGRY